MKSGAKFVHRTEADVLSMNAAEFHERRISVAMGNVCITFIHVCLISIVIGLAVKYHSVLTQFAPLWVWICFGVAPFWFGVVAITRRVIRTDIATRDRYHHFDPDLGEFSK